MSIRRDILIFIGASFLVAVFLLLGIGLFWVSPAKEGADPQVVIIAEGESPGQVAEDLHKRGIVASRRMLMLWIRVLGLGKTMKAGEYSLGAGMSPSAIMEKITKGLFLLHPVTIPEGFTRVQIASLLTEKGLAEKGKFLSMTQDPEILKRYGISGPNLEGYLFPDTYHFARGVSVQTVVDTMVKRFFQLVAPLKQKAQENGMKLQDVVILASIVEKETGLREERPLIASVFLNRLQKGMRLESDPTVIYGIEAFDGNLKKRDLAQETPYNTYVIQGLTPGPISNPGLESLRAVLYPASTEYIYFVSKNDGSHQFSKTLADHNRAVQTYQKKRRPSSVKKVP